MAIQINTEITIQAKPAIVWEVLNNFKAYPDWNPFLREVTGEVKLGNTIKINAGGMVFKPKILVYTKEQELKWIGKLFFTGLFDGTHQFLLKENTDGTTKFLHSESFQGLLVPLFKNKLLTETKANFEEMNIALKREAERISSELKASLPFRKAF